MSFWKRGVKCCALQSQCCQWNKAEASSLHLQCVSPTSAAYKCAYYERESFWLQNQFKDRKWQRSGQIFRFSSFPVPCHKQSMFWEGQKSFQVALHVKCDQPGSVGRCVSLMSYLILTVFHRLSQCWCISSSPCFTEHHSAHIPHPHTVLGGEHWQLHGAGWHSHSAEQVYPNWTSPLSLPVLQFSKVRQNQPKEIPLGQRNTNPAGLSQIMDSF